MNHPKIRFGPRKTLRPCQCSECGRVFGGGAAFDKHRVALKCRDPEASGLSVLRMAEFDTDQGRRAFPVYGYKFENDPWHA